MKKWNKIERWAFGLVLLLSGAGMLFFTGSFKDNPEVVANAYRSPETVEFSPDGLRLAANDLTSDKIYLINTASKSVEHEIILAGKPQDILWLDNRYLLVSTYKNGQILKIDATTGKTADSWEAGPNAFHMLLNGDELWVGLYGLREIAVIDMQKGKKTHSLPTNTLTWDMQLVPGKNMAVVANLIPYGKSMGNETSTAVSLYDTRTKQKIKDIKLPHGATNFRHLTVSADGKWAYAVHTRGKIALPTSQIEKGWVNTNMLSIIDLEARKWYASVLLDKVKQGAADPWDVLEAPREGALYVSIASMHELARVDLATLHRYLAGEATPHNLKANNANAYTAFNVWQTVKADPEKRFLLQDQISALYAANLLQREEVPAKGPRGLSLSPDEQTLAFASYYTGEILLKDLREGDIQRVSLGKQPAPDQVRRGEMFFHDATLTVENWLSCFSCHPDTRADGMNWDLLNDGIGNPKNTKSLVWTHLTPPAMSTGVRPNYQVAVQKGFHFIKFYEGKPTELDEVRAYLASLSPEQSPWLLLAERDKNFRKSVEKGKLLFEEAECSRCHEPPLYTNKKMYDFGVADELGITAYDVPTLRELWRTAPYWHDGSKARISEILTDPRIMDVHGKTGKLSGEQIKDLENYLLTL